MTELSRHTNHYRTVKSHKTLWNCQVSQNTTELSSHTEHHRTVKSATTLQNCHIRQNTTEPSTLTQNTTELSTVTQHTIELSTVTQSTKQLSTVTQNTVKLTRVTQKLMSILSQTTRYSVLITSPKWLQFSNIRLLICNLKMSGITSNHCTDRDWSSKPAQLISNTANINGSCPCACHKCIQREWKYSSNHSEPRH
jgi:hypothetical protein